MILYIFLAVGAIGLGVLIGLTRAVERYVGWRYLFRRRTSRTVQLFTALCGGLALASGLAFLVGNFPPGGTVHGLLAVLTVLSLMAFTTLLFLNFFSVFTTISITGVFCGVATLVVVLAVTSGFQAEFQRKVLGVNAHVLVMKYGWDFTEYPEVIKQAQSLPHVVAAAPFSFHEMMIRHGGFAAGTIVKGIVPEETARVLDIGQMQEGSLADLTKGGVPSDGGPALPGILVGKELAKRLAVKLGDRVSIISPLGSLDPSMWQADDTTPKQRDFRVVGIFYSGFDEYDRRLVLINLPEAQGFMEGGNAVTGVELKVDDIGGSDVVANRLDDLLNTKDGKREGPYRVIDWRELNHNLFTALKLQKFALSIFLTIIVFVAAFGILATLIMLVTDKTREIAILKSVGMRRAMVGRVFMAAGITIGVLGTGAGILVGIAVCFIVSHYRYHLDPRVYLIDRLPVTIHVDEMLLVALIAMCLCIAAAILPAWRASRQNPVEGLRYE